METCPQCDNPLREREASISGSVMGDEYTETYYFCGACETYTVVTSRDRFSGEESISVEGPVPKPVGDSKVHVIRRCPEPWEKKCRCEAHREYFRGWLD